MLKPHDKIDIQHIKMEKIQAYLSLGSNCGDARLKLDEAVLSISKLFSEKIRAISPVFQTEPQDYRQQDWFFNQCLKVELDTCWTAELFLKELLKLEISLGRKREKQIRFGPRVIDLDLLIFGQRESIDPVCQLPHPRMHRRAFVLLPLYLIEPCLLLYRKSLPYWLSLLNWRVSGNKIWQE